MNKLQVLDIDDDETREQLLKDKERHREEVQRLKQEELDSQKNLAQLIKQETEQTKFLKERERINSLNEAKRLKNLERENAKNLKKIAKENKLKAKRDELERKQFLKNKKLEIKLSKKQSTEVSNELVKQGDKFVVVNARDTQKKQGFMNSELKLSSDKKVREITDTIEFHAKKRLLNSPAILSTKFNFKESLQNSERSIKNNETLKKAILTNKKLDKELPKSERNIVITDYKEIDTNPVKQKLDNKLNKNVSKLKSKSTFLATEYDNDVKKHEVQNSRVSAASSIFKLDETTTIQPSIDLKVANIIKEKSDEEIRYEKKVKQINDKIFTKTKLTEGRSNLLEIINDEVEKHDSSVLNKTTKTLANSIKEQALEINKSLTNVGKMLEEKGKSIKSTSNKNNSRIIDYSGVFNKIVDEESSAKKFKHEVSKMDKNKKKRTTEMNELTTELWTVGKS